VRSGESSFRSAAEVVVGADFGVFLRVYVFVKCLGVVV
jgi:hypothetical protein